MSAPVSGRIRRRRQRVRDIHQLLDEGQGVPVLDGVLIEPSVVLDRSEGAIPLEDEKEWQCHWGVGGSNAPGA